MQPHPQYQPQGSYSTNYPHSGGGPVPYSQHHHHHHHHIHGKYAKSRDPSYCPSCFCLSCLLCLLFTLIGIVVFCNMSLVGFYAKTRLGANYSIKSELNTQVIFTSYPWDKVLYQDTQVHIEQANSPVPLPSKIYLLNNTEVKSNVKNTWDFSESSYLMKGPFQEGGLNFYADMGDHFSIKCDSCKNGKWQLTLQKMYSRNAEKYFQEDEDKDEEQKNQLLPEKESLSIYDSSTYSSTFSFVLPFRGGWNLKYVKSQAEKEPTALSAKLTVSRTEYKVIDENQYWWCNNKQYQGRGCVVPTELLGEGIMVPLFFDGLSGEVIISQTNRWTGYPALVSPTILLIGFALFSCCCCCCCWYVCCGRSISQQKKYRKAKRQQNEQYHRFAQPQAHPSAAPYPSARVHQGGYQSFASYNDQLSQQFAHYQQPESAVPQNGGYSAPPPAAVSGSAGQQQDTYDEKRAPQYHQNMNMYPQSGHLQQSDDESEDGYAPV